MQVTVQILHMNRGQGEHSYYTNSLFQAVYTRIAVSFSNLADMASKLLTKIGAIRVPRISTNPNIRFINPTTRLYSHQTISAPTSPPPSDNGKSSEKNPSVVSSLNNLELAKFSAIADTWWDSEGPFKPLHALNPTRLAFIRSTLCRHFRKDPNCAKPFEGLNIIDVGCGGGILSEDLDPSTSSIEYHCTTAENLVEEQRKFDAVISLEVIEHVANPAQFCKSLSALTQPRGATIISTINRTMRSYLTAIVAAEYILHWLPKGTHQWSSFLTPEELVLILKRASIDVKEMAGFVYNPLNGRWSLSTDVSVNFIAFGTKSGQ